MRKIVKTNLPISNLYIEIDELLYTYRNGSPEEVKASIKKFVEEIGQTMHELIDTNHDEAHKLINLLTKDTEL